MATNRVDKILVTNGTDRSTVAALTAGDFIVLVDGKAANTAVTVGDKFQVAVKRQSGEVKYADPIKASDIKSVTKEVHRAVVEQAVEVKLGTPVAGEEYALTIVDKSDKEILQNRQDKRTYLVTAETGDSAADVASEFTSQVNNDKASSVVATIGTGSITNITIDSGGSAYTAPTITISGGGGSGATATAVVEAGEITEINITNGGTGYTSAPTVTITDGAGSGADATAEVGPGADSIILTAKDKDVNPNIVGQYGLQHYFSVALRIENDMGHYKSFGEITPITSPDFGNGTIPHIRVLEQWSAGYDGILNRRGFPIPAVQYDSVVGQTYDVYTIEYDNNYWSNSVVYGKVDSPISLVLAVQAGQGANLEAILTNFL